MRFRDTGTRLRGVTVPGDYGNPDSIDWTEATLNKLDLPCKFEPGSVIEDVVQQQRIETRPRVFLYANADITATDRFRYAGVDYEVVGDPQPWPSLSGRKHHRQFELLRVTGG